MPHRSQHSTRPGRVVVAPVHRGPQAETPGHPHAPNAALLIDFDNVTMGIRSDLQTELRNLLSSSIISGKVAVQRAYADWRRYPQYIVPLSESSIDLIFAPAYGSSKKNATDIRLAVDAMELVFTRPEIGTFILLSGDSDFSSLVLKLKEYGKYVIGVGIRESSSDLLVQNCDEYYSYNALAGLVKSGDEAEQKKWDPWELVTEAIGRMQRNGDVMRSDRLKQVMVEIDPSFDEKNLGMAKFSRFCLEASQKGLLHVVKLENGQLEVGPAASKAGAAPTERAERPAAGEPREEREGGRRRGRRGRGGRGRDRDRERTGEAAESAGETSSADVASTDAPAATGASKPAAKAPVVDATIGAEGLRLTRDEAFDLVRRAVAAVTRGDAPVPAERIRAESRTLLARDSESLSERNFTRILKDAHDAGILDLRKRGESFEVLASSGGPSIADQLASAEAAATPVAAPAAPAPRGMGPRSAPNTRGRPGAKAAVPPSLLLLGVVDEPVTASASTTAAEPESAPAEAPKKGRAKAKKAAAAPAEKPVKKKAPAKKKAAK